MRIAYIAADHGIPVFGAKGASVHIQEMANAFSSLGHQVTIFAGRLGSRKCSIDAQVIKLSPATDSTALRELQLEGDARQRAREKTSLALSTAACERLVEMHKTSPFDLIYERYSLFSTAGVQAAKRLGIPCVVEVNSPLVLEQQRYRKLLHVREARDVEAQVFRNAGALLPVSEQVRTYCLSKGAQPAGIHVVPNGVDTHHFHPDASAASLAEAAGRCIIGFVGSLKPWHGIDVLMDTFRSMQARGSNGHLLVVGDGPLRSWVEGYASGAGLADRVTITGWVDKQALAGWIRAMDIAVAPYPDSSDFYFSPLKLYEYMACGVPVVASALGQIKDAIQNEVTGLLAAPGDADDLARNILRLAGDHELRATLGRAAAGAVSGRTWQANARQVCALVSPMLQSA